MSLDPTRHRRIFLERIVPREFGDAVPSPAPAVVLMGGQPGSGKSGLLDAATAYLSTPQAPAVQIVGDDLRDYHPDYQQLLAADDRTAAALTDQDSGRWVEMSLEHARRNRYSVVVEGTMRNPQVPLRTAAAFRDAGYRVEAWVMAVDPLSSKLGILARYHEQRQSLGHGRFTIDAAHDAGAAGLLASVDALQDTQAVDRIVVATRGPNIIADYPGAAGTPRVREVINAERTRPWSPQEVQDYVERADQISAALPTGHEHRPVLDRLVAAARDRGEHHEAVRTDVEPTVEAMVEVGPATQRGLGVEVSADGQSRGPGEVDRAPETAAELELDVGPNVERAGGEPDRVDPAIEMDDVEVEHQLGEPASVWEPVAAVEPTEQEPTPEVDQLQPEVDQPQPQVDQSPVEQAHAQQLDVDREVTAEVDAEPLQTPEPDPATEQARVDAAAAERDRQEHARAALAAARRQMEAADAQRQAREAATATEAPLERAQQNAHAAMAAAEQARLEDAEHREQLSRWHEHDHREEREQGIDDGPSLGRD